MSGNSPHPFPGGASRAGFRLPLGFTLIEVLVVTFILSAMIGLVALRLTRDDRDLVREEADRFVVLVQAAREESILQGSLLTIEMQTDGYRFLRINDQGKFVPLDEGSLAPRRLPERMNAQVEVEGQPAAGTQAIVLDPSGMFQVFRIAFVLNDTRWWVLGQQNGNVRSAPVADERSI